MFHMPLLCIPYFILTFSPLLPSLAFTLHPEFVAGTAATSISLLQNVFLNQVFNIPYGRILRTFTYFCPFRGLCAVVQPPQEFIHFWLYIPSGNGLVMHPFFAHSTGNHPRSYLTFPKSSLILSSAQTKSVQFLRW